MQLTPRNPIIHDHRIHLSMNYKTKNFRITLQLSHLLDGIMVAEVSKSYFSQNLFITVQGKVEE